MGTTTLPSNEVAVGGSAKTGLLETEISRSADMAANAVAASARAEVEACYVMALRNPRNEAVSRDRIMAALESPTLARSAVYAKPIGNGKVEGPSIRLAETMIRLWGNIKVTHTIVYDDADRRICKVTVRDLEVNTSYDKDIFLDKTVERKNGKGRDVLSSRLNSFGETVYIVRATEDELANKEASAASKAIRNSGLRLIPEDIIADACAKAKLSMKGTSLSDVLSLADSLSIPRAAIQAKFGTTELLPDAIAELASILNAIKDGQAKWADYIEQGAGDKGEESTSATPTSRLKERMATTAPSPDPTPANGKKAFASAVEKLNAGKHVRDVLDDWKYDDVENIPSKDQQAFLDAVTAMVKRGEGKT